MKTKDGKIEDDPRLIANIWKDYYHDILNGKEETHTNQTEDTLTEEEENEVKCPTETEVQEEIRSLRNNKAPGLAAWMGLVKVPTMADCWSTDPLLNFRFPRSVFSRNPFEILRRTIHFADNNQAIAGDKLLKNYKDLYATEEYAQATHIISKCMQAKKMPNVTPEDIVTFVTQDIIGVGRTLVTDNWCTSLPLAKRMLDSDTHLIGTIRKNRKGLPKDVDKKLKKEEVAAMENKDGITVLKWKDQRDVYLYCLQSMMMKW
ncbi:Transposase IS4 [Popillia japonica]|uniref:Transposase IS4 n=1 Tax=Popillia japonica TaxID=7064 RepID=A0AAW1MDT4_POPJA